jgi:hypothetical protein
MWFIGYEEQADLFRALVKRAADDQTRDELLRVARELDAKAADPSRAVPVVRRITLV